MPISRYQNFKAIKDARTGKDRLETFPPVSSKEVRQADDIVIEVNDAQRIDALAAQHLGDGRYWWVICLLNDMVFPFGKEIKAGTLLRIPSSVDKFVNLIQTKISK